MAMADFSVLQLLLTFMILFIVIFGCLINWFQSYLPVFLRQTFLYGKFAYAGKPSKFIVLEVPKSWFKHFYVFSSIYSLLALHLVIDVHLYGAQPPKFVLWYLDLLCGPSRKTECGTTPVIIALSLMTLQCFRRFYETWFVSVFSKGKINITHYLVGFIHYWAAITIIVAEAPVFQLKENQIEESSLTFIQILGIVLFCAAWIHQYKAAIILANLRKNSNGQVVTVEHKIPQGGLFKFLSSPHLTCEVLIYLSFLMILLNSQAFNYVFVWVFSNQLETSLLNHWWYKKTFKSYPIERKAFIPFIL